MSRSSRRNHSTGPRPQPARVQTATARAVPAARAAADPIPLWPGLVVTALCGLVYLAVGSGGTFRFLPSTFVHHTLTANAWLQGRLYATRSDLVGQFLRNRELRRGRVVSPDQSADQLLQNLRNEISAEMRHRGYPDSGLDSAVARALTEAFHDWVRVGDRYYGYWPPLPAVMMLPLVWASGPAASDVLVTNLLGVASILFIYLMLRGLQPQWPALTTAACVALTVAYGVGTCHLYQACLGQVWYLTQISATLFLTIAIWCGLNAMQRPTWMGAAGVALGIAFLGRNTLILAAPFFAVGLWIAVRRSSAWLRDYLLYGSLFAAALVAAIVIQLAFNQARFGDALDFGQGHLAESGGNPRFNADFKQYGRFNLHYVPHNLWYYFVNPRMGPLGGRRAANDGQRSFDPEGNSLFLVSPFMLYLLTCWRRRDLLLAAVVAGAIPGTLALMLFHATGWYEFGQRYLLDTMPFLLILAAFGMRGRLTPTASVLILLSIVVNAWGTYRFHLEQP